MLFIKTFKDGLKSRKTLYFYILLFKFVGMIFFISFFPQKIVSKCVFLAIQLFIWAILHLGWAIGSI